jgi:hypothetical protein
MEITLEKAFLHGAHVLFETIILQISSSFILFQKRVSSIKCEISHFSKEEMVVLKNLLLIS